MTGGICAVSFAIFLFSNFVRGWKSGDTEKPEARVYDADANLGTVLSLLRVTLLFGVITPFGVTIIDYLRNGVGNDDAHSVLPAVITIAVLAPFVFPNVLDRLLFRRFASSEVRYQWGWWCTGISHPSPRLWRLMRAVQSLPADSDEPAWMLRARQGLRYETGSLLIYEALWAARRSSPERAEALMDIVLRHIPMRSLTRFNQRCAYAWLATEYAAQGRWLAFDALAPRIKQRVDADGRNPSALRRWISYPFRPLVALRHKVAVLLRTPRCVHLLRALRARRTEGFVALRTRMLAWYTPPRKLARSLVREPRAVPIRKPEISRGESTSAEEPAWNAECARASLLRLAQGDELSPTQKESWAEHFEIWLYGSDESFEWVNDQLEQLGSEADIYEVFDALAEAAEELGLALSDGADSESADDPISQLEILAVRFLTLCRGAAPMDELWSHLAELYHLHLATTEQASELGKLDAFDVLFAPLTDAACVLWNDRAQYFIGSSLFHWLYVLAKDSGDAETLDLARRNASL